MRSRRTQGRTPAPSAAPEDAPALSSPRKRSSTPRKKAAERAPVDLVCPATPEDLRRFVREVLEIEVADSAILPGSTSPFSYLVHAFFEGTWGRVTPDPAVREPADAGYVRLTGPLRPRPTDCVVWASRGGGKTMLGALATLLDLLFKSGVEVRMLGGSLEQSQRLAEHLRRFLELDALKPRVLRVSERGIVMRSSGDFVGGRAAVLTHSQASVRGVRVQKLRCDEVELFDPEVWEAAQLTTRSIPSDRADRPWGARVRGAVEAFSTLHRPLGLMWSIVESAARPGAIDRAARSATAPNEPVAETDDVRRPTTRVLFRWSVLDVLKRCGPEHQCARCALSAACAGRAKPARDGGLRLEGDPGGHVRIADAVQQKQRVDRRTWEVEMLSARPSRGGTVLPQFDVERHVYGGRGESEAVDAQDAGPGAVAAGHAGHAVNADMDAPAVYVAGMDFGFRAPTVILWGVVEPAGVLRITHEYVEAERTLDEHVRVLTGESPGPEQAPSGDGAAPRAAHPPHPPRPAWVAVDPAGTQRNDQTGVNNVSILQQAGLVVKHRISGIHEGICLLRRRLEGAVATGEGGHCSAPGTPGPGLMIHARCVRLIRAMQCYRYPPDQPESLTPLKDGHDHVIDALRYLVVNLDAGWETRSGAYVGGGGGGPFGGGRTARAARR